MTMQTKEQVEAEFKAKLAALLDEYRVEDPTGFWTPRIEASDHYQGYPECGEDIRIIVSLPPKRDSSGELIRDYAEIDLGSSFDSQDGKV